MSCFRGNKMPGCLTLEIRFLYVSPRCIYDKYRSGRLCSDLLVKTGAETPQKQENATL